MGPWSVWSRAFCFSTMIYLRRCLFVFSVWVISGLVGQKTTSSHPSFETTFLRPRMFDVKIWINASCMTCAERRYWRERSAQRYPLEGYQEHFRNNQWSYFEWYQPQQLRNARDACWIAGDQSEEDVLWNALWWLGWWLSWLQLQLAANQQLGFM